MSKTFAELEEREILALAIALEEERFLRMGTKKRTNLFRCLVERNYLALPMG